MFSEASLGRRWVELQQDTKADLRLVLVSEGEMEEITIVVLSDDRLED